MQIEQVRAVTDPIVASAEARIYDLEYSSGILRIWIDRDDGIDSDSLGEISLAISDALDRHDVMGGGKYLLEVSSPGIERRLRTSEHFAGVVGECIAMKLREAQHGRRRFTGTLCQSENDTISVRVDEPVDVTLVVDVSEIESAHLVFDWKQALAGSTSRELDETSDLDDAINDDTLIDDASDVSATDVSATDVSTSSSSSKKAAKQ